MKDITNTHPRYDEYVELWEKARDFYDGEEAVKAKGEVYLPKSNDKTQYAEVLKYFNYKARAFFYEATSRTVEGLVGLATHKSPTITLPTSMAAADEYIQGDSTTEVMVQDIIRENILTARQGLLVDRDEGEGTQAYVVQYTAEQIINWHYEGDVLMFAVLKEVYNEYEESDPYNTSESIQYRELRMVDGIYIQNIWRKGPHKYEIYKTASPTNRGVSLDHIPFIFTSRDKLGNSIDKSPIMPMVNTNCHHYQLNADYAHALHYVAMPTLALYGFEGDASSITVGGDVALVFSDPTASAAYVEISGQGLPSMEKALLSMEDHMAHLGSRLLQSRAGGVESAEAIRLIQSAETSSLMSVVNVAEQALQAVYDEIAAWENISTAVVVDLNKDFIDVNLQPTEIDALVKAYVAKTISLETLLFNLQRGELLPEDRTIEDEILLINKSNAEEVKPPVLPIAVTQPVDPIPVV